MPKSCSSVNNSLEIFKPCKTHWYIIHHYPHLMTLGHCRLLDLKSNCMIPMCTRNLQTLAGKNQRQSTVGYEDLLSFSPKLFTSTHVLPFHPFLGSQGQCSKIHGWPRDESLDPHTLGSGGRRVRVEFSWAKWSCWRLSSPLLRGFSNQTSMGMFSTRLNWDLWNPIYIPKSQP